MPERKTRPEICDYEGSNYRTEFWENQGREYEDRVERVALRRMLPRRGKRLLEIGAGFGRLTEEYAMYDQVVLLDYSFSQLRYARDHYGDDKRFIYVAADAYSLPFRAGVFDGASMIRTIHHMSDVRSVLRQVRRVMAPGGTFILEHANKQNLKAILRYALKKQDWNPHALEPVEFVELNFDFHPQYIKNALEGSGFALKQRIPVSFFRVDTLKKSLPLGLLVTVDSVLQYSGLLVAPSVFTRSVATGQSADNTSIHEPLALMACPETGETLTQEGDTLFSTRSGLRYSIRDGIYDFKASLD